ncbi:hypothetical protein [Pelosinus sp. IPA-1]|nr:hypothetical protein [Pelosinus sp. IPA-1]
MAVVNKGIIERRCKTGPPSLCPMLRRTPAKQLSLAEVLYFNGK